MASAAVAVRRPRVWTSAGRAAAPRSWNRRQSLRWLRPPLAPARSATSTSTTCPRTPCTSPTSTTWWTRTALRRASASGVGSRAADFRPEISVLVIPDELSAPPPRPTGPPKQSRPLGLFALVVALVIGLVALIALAPDREGRDDQVALRTAEETTTTAAGSRRESAPPTATSELSGPGSGSTPRPGPGVAISPAPTVASGTVSAVDQPSTSPVTTAPTITTTTSQPPAAFALPPRAARWSSGASR